MAKPLPNGLPRVPNRLHQAEHLGNTLYRERHQGVACAVIAAIVAIDRDAQLVRRHIGQRRNVVSHFALADQGTYFFENLVQQRLHERPCISPQTTAKG
ncbi:hypothetical protein D3C75_1136660 [compost metagenome]